MSENVSDYNYYHHEVDNSWIAFGQAFLYILYALAILFGIPCNVFVLYRMIRLAMKSNEVYNNGTGICLMAMAIADLVCLASVCIHYVLSFDFDLDPLTHKIVCKLVIFSTHVSTSVSIWSWLLMSTLRYLSVYHPLLHYRLWRLPVRVLTVILGGASITNLALLLMVVYKPGAALPCTLAHIIPGYPLFNRFFLILEIIWSFCIPSCIIIFVDSSVYMCRKRYAVLSQYNCRSSATQKKSRNAMWRWLVIALIDVGLNAPENMFRLALLLNLIDVDLMATQSYFLGRQFAQVLYYMQFGFNGMYLALFIYDKSTKPLASHRGSGRATEIKSQVCNSKSLLAISNAPQT